jgi:hypothetical protein
MQSAGSVERECMGGMENFVLYVVRVAKYRRYRGEMSPQACTEKELIHGKKNFNAERGGDMYCV